MKKTIAAVTTGTRVLQGTSWPIDSYVDDNGKDFKGCKTWTLHKGVCNGAAEGSETFSTRKAALKALEEYTGQSV